MTANARSAPSAHVSTSSRGRLLRLGLAGLMTTTVLTAATVAQARITSIQILSRGTAFGGYSFPLIGQYEFITGIATGEVDPTDQQNALITDIALAPRNQRGNVVYQHNFYILKPLDLSHGNHKMMYEPPNRGSKTYQTLNNTPTGTNDPQALTDPDVLQSSFLWSRGYTTVWSGWENNLGPLTGLVATASLPVATGPGNATITGPGYEYIVSPGATYTLAYPAASGTQGAPNATLTHRVHLDDPPQPVPASGWAYTDATNTAIKLTTGSFITNDIYEFSYIAKNPTVNGLGLAAIRDFNAFLRFAKADDAGTPNPLAGDVQRIYTETSSQPARTLNDFVHLGFNEDEQHRKVFDGMMQWIGAGDGLNMNYRWSQTKRTERNRQEELYLEGLYPFANVPTYDPISNSIDWRYKRCEETRTCPLATEFYSANEYWVKAGSLMSTDPTGRFDLPDHPLTRLYFLSSKQHGGAGDPTSKGLCQQFLNPLDSAPVAARAVGPISTSDGRPRASPPPESAGARGCGRRDAGEPAAAAVARRLPEHPRRHLYGPEDDPLSLQLRAEFLSDLHADHKPAGHHPALRGQSGERSDLSELRAEDRLRRQRHRRHPAAGADRAARDLHRLGPALRRVGERRLRGVGPIHSVRGDQGATAHRQ